MWVFIQVNVSPDIDKLTRVMYALFENPAVISVLLNSTAELPHSYAPVSLVSANEKCHSLLSVPLFKQAEGD